MSKYPDFHEISLKMVEKVVEKWSIFLHCFQAGPKWRNRTFSGTPKNHQKSTKVAIFRFYPLRGTVQARGSVLKVQKLFLARPGEGHLSRIYHQFMTKTVNFRVLPLFSDLWPKPGLPLKKAHFNRSRIENLTIQGNLRRTRLFTPAR